MTTPVIFRKDRAGITAVFPTLPASYGDMTCYARVGQHSGCTFDWYNTTRPAAPAEYADLLAELRSIGYDDLQVCKRISWQMRRAREAAERRA